MKPTRRELAAALLLPAAALAQTRPPAVTTLPAARELLKTRAGALAAVKLPMSTEPAFQFKA
jgi:hypothetical protein